MAPKSRRHFKTITNHRFSKDYINKAINDKCIEMLQMRWYVSNTSIRFMLHHNQTVEILLEDYNLHCILEISRANLTRDKIKSTDTATAVWLR